MNKILNSFSQQISPKSEIKRYKALQKVKSVFTYVFMLVILVAIGYVIIYPLMYMISASFRTGESYYDPTITWITEKVTLDNYQTANGLINYWNSLKNTVLYELIASVIQLFVCSVVAYGLARFDFKEKKLLIGLLFLTIIIPVQMTMLPTYENYSHLDVVGILGLVNKLFGVDLRVNVLDTPLVFYLPSLFGVGLRSGIVIFIYMQFFKSFPNELEEAAWLDGCGPWKTFFKIVLPSSSVVIFTNLIFSVIWFWNDYFLAGLYLKSRENFTLAVSLSQIIDALPSEGIGWTSGSPEAGSIIMAACTLFVAPVLIMYVFLQRKFVKSIDRVGITG